MQTGALWAGEGKSVWVVGDLYTFLATGEDTGGAYAMIHTTVPPQGGPPPHIHRWDDATFYVLEGEPMFQVDDRTIPASTVNPSGLEPLSPVRGQAIHSALAGEQSGNDRMIVHRLSPK